MSLNIIMLLTLLIIDYEAVNIDKVNYSMYFCVILYAMFYYSMTLIASFYPLKQNLVASSRPKPSLGATFLLRYEFVKSANKLRQRIRYYASC